MLLWFWARAAACAFAARDPWLRGAAAGLAGSVLAFAVNSVWSPLLVRGIGVPLAVVFGLIAALGMIQKGDAGAEATRTD
jgi:ABC-type uncharacterized transport system permease subunit